MMRKEIDVAKSNAIQCVLQGTLSPETAQTIFPDLVILKNDEDMRNLVEKLASRGYNSNDNLLELRNAQINVVNLVRVLEWIRTAKHYEWTEEDEKLFKSIIWHVRNSVNNGNVNACGGQCEDLLLRIKEILTKKGNQL